MTRELRGWRHSPWRPETGGAGHLARRRGGVPARRSSRPSARWLSLLAGTACIPAALLRAGGCFARKPEREEGPSRTQTEARGLSSWARAVAAQVHATADMAMCRSGDWLSRALVSARAGAATSGARARRRLAELRVSAGTVAEAMRLEEEVVLEDAVAGGHEGCYLSRSLLSACASLGTAMVRGPSPAVQAASSVGGQVVAVVPWVVAALSLSIALQALCMLGKVAGGEEALMAPLLGPRPEPAGGSDSSVLRVVGAVAVGVVLGAGGLAAMLCYWAPPVVDHEQASAAKESSSSERAGAADSDHDGAGLGFAAGWVQDDATDLTLKRAPRRTRAPPFGVALPHMPSMCAAEDLGDLVSARSVLVHKHRGGTAVVDTTFRAANASGSS